MNILIVEDDKNLNEGLSFTFSNDGYDVKSVFSKAEAINYFNSMKKIDLIILDCNLPDGDGFEICQYIRSCSEVPIIMLTARDLEIDEVMGLELGADDYIKKPFSLSVLKLRVKSLLRRRNSNKMIYSNDIRIDQQSLKVYKNDEEIILTSIEFKLLYYLIINKNKIVLKDQLLDYVWDSKEECFDDNLLSVNIRRLRVKIEDNPSNPVFIKTVYGMGYMWTEVV